MSITAVFTGGASYSGDESTAGTATTASSTNSDAPDFGARLVNLSSGFNTITLPTGHTVYGVSIFPPSGNSTSLTLKGITGDTGIPLHVTKASHIALVTGATTFGLTAGSAMSVRLAYW